MRKALLALALVLAGCGPYIDEVNAAHRGRVEAKLEQVHAVGKALAAQPPLAEDRLPLPKAQLGYGWSATKPANAAFIYAEDFASLDELGWVYGRAKNVNLVQRCSSLLHTEREPWDPGDPDTAPHPGFGFEAGKIFEACENLEYLFVIRTRAFAKPSEARRHQPVVAAVGDAGRESDAGPEAGTSGDSQSRDFDFDGGYLDAEILVFELASARFMGGFRFQVESSSTLRGEATAGVVREDFRTRVSGELARVVHERAPEVGQVL